MAHDPSRARGEGRSIEREATMFVRALAGGLALTSCLFLPAAGCSHTAAGADAGGTAQDAAVEGSPNVDVPAEAGPEMDAAPDLPVDLPVDLSAPVDLPSEEPGTGLDAIIDIPPPVDLPSEMPATDAPAVDTIGIPETGGMPDMGGTPDTGAMPDGGKPTGVPMFIAVGYGFRRVLSCTDGHDWQTDQIEVANPGGNDDSLAHGLAYSNGLFVAAVGGGGNAARIMTTTDGVTWTERLAKGMYNGFSQVSFGNGTFVAGGGNISIRSMTGLAGWGDLTLMGSGGILRHMVFGAGHFVAVGANRVEYGTNGVDWMAAATGTCGEPVDVIFGGGRHLAVDNAGVTCLSTDGGLTWTKGTVGGGNIRGLVWNGTTFIVTATDKTYRSPDGMTWTSASGGGPATIAISDKGTYVGVANSGFVYSTDGTIWTPAPSPASAGNNGITRIVFGYGAASATCPAK